MTKTCATCKKVILDVAVDDCGLYDLDSIKIHCSDGIDLDEIPMRHGVLFEEQNKGLMFGGRGITGGDVFDSFYCCNYINKGANKDG